MKHFDARAGIGSGIDAVNFVSPARVEVARDLASITPVLRQIRKIEERPRDHTREGYAQRQAMVADVARGITHPLWNGVNETSHFVPNSDTNTVEGLEVVGEDIFEGSQNARIIRSAATGDAVLMLARSPHVESSVITGGILLGGGPGSNTKEYDSPGLKILLDLSEGIHTQNGDQILKGLADLKDKVLDSYDRELYGSYRGGDNEGYRTYGELDSAAMVFDSYYLPTLQQGETTNISVSDSIIAGRYTLRQVLGGEVSESAIVSGDALSYAHVRIRDTFILSGDGGQFIERARIGDPDRAKDLIEAVEELPERPLAAFAA